MMHALVEYEESSDVEQIQQEDIQLDQDVEANADLLVTQLVQDLAESEGNNKLIDQNERLTASNSDSRKHDSSPAHHSTASEIEVPSDAASTEFVPSQPQVAYSPVANVTVQHVVSTSKNVEFPREVGAGTQRKQIRSNSCPPRADQSLVSGP
jgi:hypothetical protein